MPKVIPSSELRNGYNELSTWCHLTNEPAFVTKNGSGDLAVMSIQAYDEIRRRLEMYEFIEAGRRDVASERVVPASEHSASLRERYGL